jgi:fused signal recognition particle receptor
MELLLVVLAIVVVVAVGLALVARRGVGGSGARTVDREPPAATSVVEAPALEETLEVEESVAGEQVLEESASVVEGAAIDDALVEASVVEASVVDEAIVEEVDRPRFRDRLTRARDRFAGAIGALRGSRVDDRTWEDLEDALLSADVGVTPTTELLASVRAVVAEQGITEGDGVLEVLKDQMRQRLGSSETDLALAPEAPTIWLLVGVNGVGKTTTAGKLARREVVAGRRVMLAAGDTFRAAAAEQLGMWAERTGADIVRGEAGGDPSAVVFDAVEAAAARGHDLVIADTAGRLHTKSNLMDELAKVRRVADKGDGTVTESLLVLDATTGQNGLVQARQFAEAVELTGVVLTKLDGSAKGGIVLAIQSELGVPVKLVGLGEGADDLVPFDADEFVEALFS